MVEDVLKWMLNVPSVTAFFICKTRRQWHKGRSSVGGLFSPLSPVN